MHLRALLPRALAVATAFVLAACGESATPTASTASGQPQLTISDAANTPGRTGFYWLQPMVANPGPFSGTFDGTLSPTLTLCALVPATAPATGLTCGSTLKTFTRTSAGDQIKVDLNGQAYILNWNTKNNPASLTTGRDKFRVVASVGGITLGFADLWFVSTSKQLSTVQSGYVGMVLGSSVFVKFRIETRTIGTVTVSPSTASVELPFGGAAAPPQAFTATVTDLKGNSVSAATLATVQWASSDPSIATVPSTTGGTTNATGLAVGTTTITATIGGVSGSASLDVTQGAGHLAVAAQPSATASGSALSPQPAVQVVDANGTAVAAAGITITAALTSTSTTAMLAGTTTATTDASGRATFTDLALSGQAGTSETLTFSATGASDATSANIRIVAGAAAKLAFITQPVSAYALDAIDPAGGIVVQIQDAFGNRVPVATNAIALALKNAVGDLTGGGTTNAVAGEATFSGLSVSLPSSGQALVATASGNLQGATSQSFDVRAIPTSISCVVPATSLVVGTSTAMTATVTDVLHQAPIEGITVRFSEIGGKGGSFSPTTDVTDATGKVTTTWSLPTTAGSVASACSIVVAGTPYAPAVDQVLEDLVADVPTQITISPATASIVAGTSVKFSYVLKDQYGNVNTKSSAIFAGSDPTVATVTSSGLATGLQVAAPTTITVTASVSSTLNATASLTVTPATAPTAVDDLGGGGSLGYYGFDLNSNVTYNDALGNPAATVTQAGGGSFSGMSPVDTPLTGLNGSTLLMRSSGFFQFHTAVRGTYSFDYTLANIAGTSTGTVVIVVTDATSPCRVTSSVTTVRGRTGTKILDVPVGTSTAASTPGSATKTGDKASVQGSSSGGGC